MSEPTDPQKPADLPKEPDPLWAEAARLTRVYAMYVVTERRERPVIETQD